MSSSVTKPRDWLICESAPRWATAIRQRLARRRTEERELARVREVRTFAEADQVLDQRDICLIVLEASEENLRDLLQWLPNCTEWNPWLAVVACLNSSLVRNHSDPNDPKQDTLRGLPSLLREAGCLDVIETPFQVQRIIETGTMLRSAASQRPVVRRDESVISQLRGELPWQG